MNRTTLILGILIAATCAGAADYYVSSIRTGRSDANAGTNPDAPWATFDNVMIAWGSVIKPGDTVHLERGSLWDISLGSDGWLIEQGGSVAGGIMTIRGDTYGSGAAPIIRRSLGSTEATFIWIHNASYITLQGFVIDGGSAQGRNTGGILIGGWGQDSNISHINVMGMTLKNLAASSAYYTCGIWLQPYNNFTVSDCLIENNSISGYNAHGLNHYPVKTTAQTQSLLNNITYRNNHMFGMSTHYGSVGTGIHISFGGSNNTFEYNLIEGPHNAGSVMMMNCANNETGSRFRYNVITGNTVETGLIIGADGSGATATVSFDIYGNLIAGSTYAGIWLWSRALYSGNINIYNNTLYDNNRVGTVSWLSGGQILVDADSDAVNLNVRNNLLVSRANNTSGLYIQSGYTGSVLHDHNLYWHTSGSTAPAIFDRGTAYTVANALSFEPTARNTDALLINGLLLPTSISSTNGAAPDGLSLQAGSPAIDTGATLLGPFAIDIDGIIRPQGSAWDIGAYEIAGAPPPPPPPAPTGLTATPISPVSIVLAWTDNATNETGFSIERSLNGTTFTGVTTVPSNTTTFTDTELLPGMSYFYRLFAVNNSGVSGYSAIAQATTPAMPDTTPPTLIAVRAGVGDPSRLSLTFTEPLTPATATQTLFYSISGFTRITAAIHADDFVVLSVAPALSDQAAYTLSLSNLQDTVGNTIGNTQTSFVFQAGDPSRVAWYPFEGNASDLSGNGNDATASGTTLVSTGRIGQAYLFDAITDYIQLPFDGMTPSAGTVALWIKPRAFRDSTAPQYIFGQSAALSWSNTIQFYTDDAAGNLDLGFAMMHPQAEAIVTMIPGQWVHLAVVWDATHYWVYVDGANMATGTHTGLGPLSTIADVGNTGRSSARTQGFDGLIDDVQIYTRVLTAPEIWMLANPLSVPRAPSAAGAQS